MYQYGYQAPKQRKVAVYARVSTEHEAQLSALENQKDWYKPIIAQHPEWDIVRMYTDEGITGTSAQKRPQFMKMIEDAGDGEFDLILTREVARFARNTVDTLQYTRSLKAKGVEVFFINDNIKTFDGDGELRLTIMATLAQDESRKTSIRVKCGQQTSMDNGVFYGNGNILGYDRVGKDMVINPEQAKTVRMIYDWYLDGVGIRAIKFRLEQAGRLTATGKSNWHESNISKILQNSFYCGIITYHKEYTPDFLEQKKIRNFGEIELTKTRGTHEPIITEEEFERVQEMIAKRRKELPNTGAGKRRQIGEKQPGDVWTELLICECGHKFNRKVWHRVEDDVQYGYQCYSSIRTGTVTTRLRKGLPIDDVCKTPMIAGWKLQMMVKNIFREYLHNTAEVLALAEAMLERHIDDEEPQTDNNRLIEQKQAEAEKLNKRLHSLIEMRADGEITRDIFKAKKQEIEDRLLAIQNELSQLQPQEEAIDDATHDEKIKILKFYLEQSVNPDAMDNIPEDVIRAFIVKVVVHENSFDWYLRFSPDKPPKSLCIDGKRKTTAKVSSLCSPQHRLLLEAGMRSNFYFCFTINYEQAKAFRNANGQYLRQSQWEDITVEVIF